MSRVVRALVVLVLVALALPASAKPRLAFLGLRSGASVQSSVADGVSDYTQTELANLGVYEVIGLHDIDSLLGLEQKKQLLGCNDDGACVAELSGALGVDRALTGSLAKVGDSIILNLTLLDVTKAKVVGRVGQRVSIVRGMDPVLDAVRPLLDELVAEDGHAPAPEASDQPSPLEVVALLRGEANLNPMAATGAAGVVVQDGFFGGVATVVGPVKGAAIPVGLRVEARLSPFYAAPVRPYLTGGVALFSDAPALRGSVGVELVLPPARLFVDLATERLLSADQIINPVILGLGAGYAF